MHARIYRTVGVISVLFSLALMSAAPADAKVVQAKWLTATGTPETWETVNDPAARFIHVYANGREIEQHWVSGCRASYPSPGLGLYIWVRVVQCASPEWHPYIIRYLSASGRQRFHIDLTTTASG